MTVTIHTVPSTDTIQTYSDSSAEAPDHRGYRITRVYGEFTDWDGGNASLDEPEIQEENEASDASTKGMGNRTMKMGNRTEIDYDEYSNPSGSYKINGMPFYERLDAHNRDNHWQYRTDDKTTKSVDKDFKIHLVRAFGSQLELNSIQINRVFNRFIEIDLPKATGRSEVNVFLLCARVANQSAERFDCDKLYHPQRPPENNDETFQELAETLADRFSEINESYLTKVYNKLTQGNLPTRPASEWAGFVDQESPTLEAPPTMRRNP